MTHNALRTLPSADNLGRRKANIRKTLNRERCPETPDLFAGTEWAAPADTRAARAFFPTVKEERREE